MLVTITIFFFIGSMVDNVPGVGTNNRYGGSYFSFVLIGLIFHQYMSIALNGYLATISSMYWSNKMEILLISPIKIGTFLNSSMIWSYFRATFYVILYLLIGVLIFKVNINFSSSWYIGILILVLTVTCLSGIGLIAASMFFLVDSKGSAEPVSWITTTFSQILSGVYFPVVLLPSGIQSLSHLFPQTHALEGLRIIFLEGGSLSSIAIQQILLSLVIFNLILIPLGIIIFRITISKAKKKGTIGRWA
jgi:ABC-2 type transport system permease protein